MSILYDETMLQAQKALHNQKDLTNQKTLNLVLGGGGIKGIAYTGVFNVAENRGYKWANIAGVSAGALAGSFLAAGYTANELSQIMEQFDFAEIDLKNISNKVPVIKRYNEIKEIINYYNRGIMQFMLRHRLNDSESFQEQDLNYFRASFLKNIVSYYKNGYLFDGDYLEEWVSKVLIQKGIRTFGDLRNGIPSAVNPNGYKIRMTAVDVNRGKVIILPDDMTFYGIDPDAFEVAKAVRMSTSVPFVFKPVVIEKKTGKRTKFYNIVDGGVLDKLPYWLIDNTNLNSIESKAKSGIKCDTKNINEEAGIKTVYFTLNGGKKKFSLATPLDILKNIVSSIYNIGVPQNTKKHLDYLGKIDASGIDFLDFNLSKEEKIYLYESGRKAAKSVFDFVEQDLLKKTLIEYNAANTIIHIDSSASTNKNEDKDEKNGIDLDINKDIGINVDRDKSVCYNSKLNECSNYYGCKKKHCLINNSSSSIFALFILLYLIKSKTKCIKY